MDYVQLLTTTLYNKYGQGKNAVGVDQEVFAKMAQYAKDNKVSLIGIINYEVAKYKGEKSFNIQYAQHSKGFMGTMAAIGFATKNESTFAPHMEHIKNTMDYLDKQGISYKIENEYIHYADGSSAYSGVKITITDDSNANKK